MPDPVPMNTKVTDGDVSLSLDVLPNLVASHDGVGHTQEHYCFLEEQIRGWQRLVLGRVIDLIEEGNTTRGVALLRSLRDTLS